MLLSLATIVYLTKIIQSKLFRLVALSEHWESTIARNCHFYRTFWVFNNIFATSTGFILESMSQWTFLNLCKPMKQNSYQARSWCFTPLFPTCNKSLLHNSRFWNLLFLISRGWIYFNRFYYDCFLLFLQFMQKNFHNFTPCNKIVRWRTPKSFWKWLVSVFNIIFYKTYRLDTFHLEVDQPFLIFRSQ